MPRETIAWIDPSAIAANLAMVRARVGRARVMAVVKADAYGHGLEGLLPALSAADLLAVATIDEARAVRRHDQAVPLLLLEGPMDHDDLHAADALNLEMVVHHPEQLAWLEQARLGPGARVWLKIDTGMHRLGFAPEQAVDAYTRLRQMPGVEEVVLMSHFACADRPDHPLNRLQIHRFDTTVRDLPGPHCLANSAAILGLPETHRDWVRAGLLLYGVSPIDSQTGGSLGLRPAMTLSTRLIAINRVQAGESIGYGARFRAPTAMRVGVAAIGYGDGYPRNMPDGAPVLVNGRRQRLVGTVSMDMITIDLSDQPEARVGDPVELWGPSLPIEEVARHADTIPYELLCRVTRRVEYRLRS
ncbi:MAG: alanine racemase [Wenzhouxiangellaceae bacterium]